ncbi:L-asparaginase [Eumeta japonica]|uniref:L-asparaginase n=1 Tax=Eumeta variegata TaxID=151549 RepID=A0A4C1TTB1_EUMVA|nr:L-asparaginase [Eumeta japonica]
MGILMPAEAKKTKVKVIYTGGTIGMMRNDRNVKRIRKYPNMHDEEYAQKRFGQSASMAPLVLPYVQGESNRVIYQITEYVPLLDSSNMTMNDWARIANDIQMMQSNLRGELTSNCGPKMEEYDLVDAVARSLHLSSPQELSQLGATLFPAMLNTAVIAGDIQKINNLKAYGADLSGVNHDHRTALHWLA